MNYTSNINDTFFQGSYKEAWKGTIPPGLSEAEVDFIFELARLKEGQKVVDLMSGYGRHTLELAKRGIHVTAIDNLPDYIEEIKTAAMTRNFLVKTLKANILGVNLEDVYDAAICMGNSFSFFNKDQAASILKNLSSHLKTGGVFILNSWMVAEIAIRHFKEHDWHWAGGYKCILDYKFLFQPSRIESEQTIISPNGDIEVLNGVDYILTIDEIEEILREAGMRIINLFSTPRKRKFSMGDGQLYLVAEKI